MHLEKKRYGVDGDDYVFIPCATSRYCDRFLSNIAGIFCLLVLLCYLFSCMQNNLTGILSKEK